MIWPLPAELTDDALAGKLFARSGAKGGQRRRVEPNWGELIVELKRPGVTMAILWEEYRAVHPQGYGYSRFCDLLRGFQRRLSQTMRQEHVAGDKVFVDYSGKKLGIVDAQTGVIREAEIFVGVLGASNFTFAEASWTQALPDRIGSHVQMFRFFGGVPRLIVPDHLKAGINNASFYDPQINRSYGMMASHYGVGVLPARVRKPRDKAKVENGVRFGQSAILGRLRNQTFFSLAEANAAISEAVVRINDHVIRRLGVTGAISSRPSSGHTSCGSIRPSACEAEVTRLSRMNPPREWRCRVAPHRTLPETRLSKRRVLSKHISPLWQKIVKI